MSEFVVKLTGDYATNAVALQRLLEDAAAIEMGEDAEGEVDVRSSSHEQVEHHLTPVLGEMLYNAQLADHHPDDVTPESYLQAVRFAFPPSIEGNRALAEAILGDAHDVAEDLIEEHNAEAESEDHGVDEDGLITDGGQRYDVENMSEERLERLANSPLVELILACEDVVGAADLIRDNEYMWTRLVRDVARNCDRIESEATAEEIITETLEQMDRYGSLGTRPETKEDGGDEDGE